MSNRASIGCILLLESGCWKQVNDSSQDQDIDRKTVLQCRGTKVGMTKASGQVKKPREGQYTDCKALLEFERFSLTNLIDG